MLNGPPMPPSTYLSVELSEKGKTRSISQAVRVRRLITTSKWQVSLVSAEQALASHQREGISSPRTYPRECWASKTLIGTRGRVEERNFFHGLPYLRTFFFLVLVASYFSCCTCCPTSLYKVSNFLSLALLCASLHKFITKEHTGYLEEKMLVFVINYKNSENVFSTCSKHNWCAKMCMGSLIILRILVSGPYYPA